MVILNVNNGKSMGKYYFDTCIWRDYFENRSDRFRPLGDWALDLINQVIQNDGFILYSDFIILEMQNKYHKKQIIEILKIVPKNNLIEVNV